VTVRYTPQIGGASSAAVWLHSLRDTVRARSAVDLAEDFGDDLQRWVGSGGVPGGWVRDTDGFVRPGQLALYVKSIPLADYRMEFLGVIERKSLSFVYRAMDFDNYYAARITIVNPGPIPQVALERYAVINGQAGPRTQVELPFSVRMDTLYEVQVEARGDRFVTRINEQFVDAFNDNRLPSGGVGFFSGAGESARILRLRIADRDDMFGKICSLLAPRFSN
jgi:hypothetical protein